MAMRLGSGFVRQKQRAALVTRTTLSTGAVKNVQESEVETLTGLLLDGEYKVNVRADKRITRAVNQQGAFRGHIVNAENIVWLAMIWSQLRGKVDTDRTEEKWKLL